MHTVTVIAGGFALLATCVLLGHAWGNGWQGAGLGAKVFLALWLACAFANMWIGTTRGYSWAAEFPIFVGIFAVPAVIAGIAWWRLA